MRTLYFMPFCPFSRKIFMGLKEKNLTFQERHEKVWHLSPQLKDCNQGGELPVLIDSLEKETLICGNDKVAMEYLEEMYPQISLMGKSHAQKIQTRYCTSWFDHVFYTDVYWTLFYERALKRYVEKKVPDTQVLKEGRKGLQRGMKVIEAWTSRSTYINGTSFSWADVTAFSHLSCIDYLGDIVWSDFPATQEWYMKIKSRPSVRNFWEWTFPGLEACSWYASLDF